MNGADRLVEAVRRARNPVVVGIDPRWEDLPQVVRNRVGQDGSRASAFEEFGRGIVDVAAGRVPAVKFQAAFYEAMGPEGMRVLGATAAYASERGLFVIMDGKRNDIGSTAEAYARGYLGDAGAAAWRVDALTVNPYLGWDGIAPFVKAAAGSGKGIFVLVRTSNPSAAEFQDLRAEGKPIYQHVAERVVTWAEPRRGASGYSLVGAVVGATAPAQLAELRERMPGVLFLIPGYGAQGAGGADVAPGFDANGLGAIVNSSRGIGFAYQGPDLRDHFGADWTGAVRQAIDEMVADLAAQTPAGRLRG